MSIQSFNLVDKPWLPCLMDNGKTEKHSLRETLKRAHEIIELSASPPVVAALTRLLVAVVHCVLDGPKDEQAWADAWRKGEFDDVAIDSYLDRWKTRFDLFHEEQPFFQARLDGVALKPPSFIDPAAASGNNPTLFDHSTDTTATPVPPDEAARLLVAFQSFVYCGFVSQEGGGRVSGKAALLSGAWVFIVSGRSLFHTLMLNTPVYNPDNEQPFAFLDDDAPVWERQPAVSAAERNPAGWLDILTYPSRRVQLVPDRDACVQQVKVTDGDRPASGWEPCGRELSLAFTRGQRNWAALAPKEERDLWRDATVLFCRTNDSNRPRVLEHVAAMVSSGYVDANERLGLEAYALATYKASYLYWRHERLSLRTGLFNTDDEGIGEAISSAIRTADKVADEVQNAVTELAGRPAGRAMSEFWSRLAAGFDRFLAALPDRRAASHGWSKSLEAAVEATWSTWSASFPATTVKFRRAAEAERFRRRAKNIARELREEDA